MGDKQTDSGAGSEARSAASSADQRAVDAWNQVGIYMETAQETWTRLAKRNFDFWKEVSGSLKNGPVNADTLAANAGRAVSAAMETAQDLWLTAVEPPRREVYAQTLPTAFVYFSKVSADTGGDASGHQETTYDNPDPVHIAVHHQRETLPETAKITISGNPTDPAASAADALAALTDRLRVHREGSARSYLLEVINPGGHLDPGGAGVPELVPGTYVGLVYLTDPPLPLANLRVVVE
ncbi:MAG: hypothetical protein QM650_18650 [Microlunatus sp.]